MFQSVPSLLMIIVIFSFVPNNMVTLVLMLALFSWTGVARIVRAQTLTLKERDFVIAAKTLGVSHVKIILKHIIPNMTTQIIVAASLSIAGAILDESALAIWVRSGPSQSVLGKHAPECPAVYPLRSPAGPDPRNVHSADGTLF